MSVTMIIAKSIVISCATLVLEVVVVLIVFHLH